MAQQQNPANRRHGGGKHPQDEDETGGPGGRQRKPGHSISRAYGKQPYGQRGEPGGSYGFWNRGGLSGNHQGATDTDDDSSLAPQPGGQQQYGNDGKR